MIKDNINNSDTTANADASSDGYCSVISNSNPQKRKNAINLRSHSDSGKKKKVKMAKEDVISIPTQSDMDEKLNEMLRSDDSESNENDSDYDTFFNDLKNNFSSIEEIGPSVRDDLAEVFNEMRDQPLAKDKIAEKTKKHLQPKNCTFGTQQVNSEIWNMALGSKERSLDLKLQKSQNLVTKATIATLKTTTDLLNLKSKKGNKKELLKTAITN